MEHYGVRLAGVGAPQHQEIGVLHLLVRTRSPACSENCRQTDDARSVSSAIAAVYVVGADDGASELLSQIVQLVRGF